MGTTLFAPAPLALSRRARPSVSSWETTLARCFDDHGAAVFGLAHRVTRDEQVAATLTAEVFAGLSEVTDETTLAECVLTDVHRRAVAWVRSASSRSGNGLTQEALAGLDAAERDVIAAAYFDGKTYTDIAQGLELSLAEVAALMQRGLRRLATLMPAATGS